MTRVPRYAYVAALVFAALVFGGFCILSLRFPLANTFPLVVASVLCVPLSTTFALIWPGPSWRWGLWISSGFWLFLAIVFFSFLAESRREWMPALDAVAIAGLACAGARFGRWLSLRLRGAGTDAAPAIE